ncbi:MAG: alpha-1,2-fucosyltransferase, partial [Butyrivibrio sp.]|uniref:alpha-1,2-fucosyltransferase n=1 Tax=Butyrivibrio sp. TaxID=28121 RepID=UPI0025F6171D
MIIIKLQGGLGNQLFLYGLYKNLKRSNNVVKMDIVSGFEQDELRIPCLDSLGLKFEIATNEEVTDIRDSYMDLFSRIRRKIFGRKTHDYYEPSDGNYDPEVCKLTRAYLNGYFQSEKYFGDDEAIKELKREILQNKDKIISSSERFKNLYRQMQETESVSLHIRRGDYLKPGIEETYGGICTDEYYEKALSMVRDKYP